MPAMRTSAFVTARSTIGAKSTRHNDWYAAAVSPATSRGGIESACLRAIAAGLGAIALAAAAAAALVSARAAVLFVVPAAAAWLFAGGTLWRARRLAPPGMTSFGAATRVTLARGWLISVVAGFALLPPVAGARWWPAALYVTAALADRCD